MNIGELIVKNGILKFKLKIISESNFLKEFLCGRRINCLKTVKKQLPTL